MRLKPDHPLVAKYYKQEANKFVAERQKYGAVPTPDSTGRVHPSKLQARVTDRLNMAGTVIPEVSIPLSERKRDRIRIDGIFIERIHDDCVTFTGRFIEAKGFDTPTGVQKRMRFTDKYGVEIQVIKK